MPAVDYESLDWRETMASPLTMATALSGGKWKPYRHLQLLDATLLRFILADEADLLLVELPVRHGKSVYISKWTAAWYVSRWPDRTVAIASHGAQFAAKWGGAARSVIEEHAGYLGVRVNPSSSAKDNWELAGYDGSGVWTAGVLGGIIGKGYHLGIVDDPMKAAKDANSQHMRDEVWDWWQGTWLSREEPGVKRVIVMSRWHSDDLIGRLEDNPEGQRIIRLRLPALAEEDDPMGREQGEALCPERYTSERLEQFRASRGPYRFAAQYQQSPIPDGGQMLDPGAVGRFSYVDGGIRLDTGQQWSWQQLRTFTTVDLAMTEKTTADWSVAMTFAVTPEGFLLVRDIDRIRVTADGHVEWLFRVAKRMSPEYIAIEEGLLGTATLAAAVRAGLRARGISTGGRDKVTRAEGIRTMLATRRIYALNQAPWVDPFLRELGQFDKGRYDDQVDTLAYGCDIVLRGERGKRPAAPAPHDVGVAHRAGFGEAKRKLHHPVMGRI